MKKLLFAATLLWPTVSIANHLDVYAAYCYHPDNRSMVRLVGMAIYQDGKEVMKWTPDPSRTKDEQQDHLERKVAKVVPDWKTHMFTMKKGIVGPCKQRL